VFLKQGPYGHYVQVGEDKKGMYPKRASLSEVIIPLFFKMKRKSIINNFPSFSGTQNNYY
jgi:hypothetical protein